jgi:hypothetical protein
LKQLQDAGRKGGLAGFETIEGVVMADEEWTPQNVSHAHTIRTFDKWSLIIFTGSHHRCAET